MWLSTRFVNMNPAVNIERTKVPKVNLRTFLWHKIDFAFACETDFYCMPIYAEFFSLHLDMNLHKLIHMNRKTKGWHKKKAHTHSRLNIRPHTACVIGGVALRFTYSLFTLPWDMLCCVMVFLLSFSWVWAWHCPYPFCFDLFNTRARSHSIQNTKVWNETRWPSCEISVHLYRFSKHRLTTPTIKSKNHFIRSNFGFALVAALQMKYER